LNYAHSARPVYAHLARFEKKNDEKGSPKAGLPFHKLIHKVGSLTNLPIV
jgi:hypothetical protein